VIIHGIYQKRVYKNVKETKTEASIRPLDVDEDVIKILKRRKISQKENKLRLGSKYNNEHDLVFTKEHSFLSYQDIQLGLLIKLLKRLS
jgi:hypothetical protein